jgi:hypothetical protein
MQHPLVMKLRRFARLSDHETGVIEQLSGETVSKDVGTDIVCQGDKPSTVALSSRAWRVDISFPRMETDRSSASWFPAIFAIFTPLS